MSSRAERERLFFALFPTAVVRRAIEGIQQRYLFEARPVMAEHFHITLAFLGEQPVDRLDALRTLADSMQLPACSLRLDRMGSFARSAVGFLAPSDLPPELQVFRGILVERLDECGFAMDRKPWRPHLTLYRKMRKPCARIPIESVDWPVRTFSLVSSRLEKTGPVYQGLGRWNAVG